MESGSAGEPGSKPISSGGLYSTVSYKFWNILYTQSRPTFVKSQFKAAFRSFTISAECQRALDKAPDERTDGDIRALYGMCQSLKSFETYSDDKAQQICRVMHYEKHDINDIVFRQGSVATAFYFILWGQVDVRVKQDRSTAELTVRTLQPGESFGELGLKMTQDNKPGRRKASIVCRTAASLLRIDIADYHAILRSLHSEELEEKIQHLCAMRIFQNWEHQRLTELSDKLKYRRFQPNDVIVRQGDDVTEDGLFFLKRGECKVVREVDFPSKRHPAGHVRKLLQIGRLGAMDYFGEVALFHSSRRTCTIISVTKVEVYIMAKADFVRRLQDPRVGGATLKYMLDRAAEYPTDAEIRKAFYEQKRWEKYKKSLVDDIVSRKAIRKEVQRFF